MLKKIKFNYLVFISITIILISFFLINQNKTASSQPVNNSNLEEAEETIEITDKKVDIEIGPGDTYGQLMSQADLDPSLIAEIYNLTLEEYDLAKIKAGHKLELTFEKDTEILKSLVYKIDSEEEIIINRDLDNWQAKRQAIDYQVEIKVKEGEIDSSLYQTALDNNIDERAIIELAKAFQWTLDFSMDTKKGDKFKFIYEARYLNDQYQMPGKILGAKYINQGQEYQLFYFEESEDNQGYFDLEANSVQKMFLKAPVEFKYISSGFTTGLRYIKAFNISTGHRAIDYAAPLGTPIRSVGDGTITFAGYQGSYGNKVSIRHNGTYSTNYAHLSRFAVRSGDRVKQGQIIGYVGSTGLSTGPHLHYEMVKNGIKINPLTEILPPGEAIKEENKERFYQEIAQWQEMIK
jgi:murein DD-endopeptidase MepM/ murein hydrolase activator NlpD